MAINSTNADIVQKQLEQVEELLYFSERALEQLKTGVQTLRTLVLPPLTTAPSIPATTAPKPSGTPKRPPILPPDDTTNEGNNTVPGNPGATSEPKVPIASKPSKLPREQLDVEKKLQRNMKAASRGNSEPEQREKDERQAEEARRKSEAEEARRQRNAEEARRKREEAEDARRQREKEEARQHEVEEARRKREAEDARRKREAEEARRKREAEEARHQREKEEAEAAENLRQAETARIAEEARQAEDAKLAQEMEQLKAQMAEIERKRKQVTTSAATSKPALEPSFPGATKPSPPGSQPALQSTVHVVGDSQKLVIRIPPMEHREKDEQYLKSYEKSRKRSPSPRHNGHPQKKARHERSSERRGSRDRVDNRSRESSADRRRRLDAGHTPTKQSPSGRGHHSFREKEAKKSSRSPSTSHRQSPQQKASSTSSSGSVRPSTKNQAKKRSKSPEQERKLMIDTSQEDEEALSEGDQ
ncbi:MAEBL protein [Aphelenchoides avenae]|nr:MAEBL protein [Aphelenchus avenae]